jgi:hypothetical protein
MSDPTRPDESWQPLEDHELPTRRIGRVDPEAEPGPQEANPEPPSEEGPPADLGVTRVSTVRGLPQESIGMDEAVYRLTRPRSKTWTTCPCARSTWTRPRPASPPRRRPVSRPNLEPTCSIPIPACPATRFHRAPTGPACLITFPPPTRPRCMAVTASQTSRAASAAAPPANGATAACTCPGGRCWCSWPGWRWSPRWASWGWAAWAASRAGRRTPVVIVITSTATRQPTARSDPDQPRRALLVRPVSDSAGRAAQRHAGHRPADPRPGSAGAARRATIEVIDVGTARLNVRDGAGTASGCSSSRGKAAASR